MRILSVFFRELFFGEKHPLRRFLELILLVSGVVGIFLSYSQNRSTALDSAWATLSQSATGNSGKRAAIETLYQHGEDLRSIDLSCSSHGGYDTYFRRNGNEKIELGQCIRHVILDGLNLSNSFWQRSNKANFSNSDFSGVRIVGGDISNSLMRDMRLEGIFFERISAKAVNFSGAKIISETMTVGPISKVETRPQILDSDLTGAIFSGAGTRLEELCIRGTNVSNVDFGHTPLPGLRCIKDAWYWSDQRPTGTERYVSDFRSCDPGLAGENRRRYIQKQAFGIPKTCH